MRRVYLVLLVVLGIAVVYGFREATRPYATSSTAAFYVGCAIAFFTLLGVLLISENRHRLADTWPVRMFRLWREAKEAELKKRAGR